MLGHGGKSFQSKAHKQFAARLAHMTLVPAMILSPILAGAGLLWLNTERFRKLLVAVTTAVIVGCALALIAFPGPVGVYGFPLKHDLVERGMLVVEAVMGLYVICVGLRARNVLIVA